jgi:type I restriction enzyme S subunit
LEEYDLLFNRTNSSELVGKTAIILNSEALEMTFASYLVRIRLFYKEILASYVCSYLNGADGRSVLLGEVTQQVGQANINPTKLSTLFIPLQKKLHA